VHRRLDRRRGHAAGCPRCRTDRGRGVPDGAWPGDRSPRRSAGSCRAGAAAQVARSAPERGPHHGAGGRGGCARGGPARYRALDGARRRGLRIVGGEARGRPLRAVPGNSVRPTADRVRQSLFDALGQRVDGLAVLDLYAGTGALALEAVSRGAARAVLIENDARACAAIFHNIASLKYEGRCRVLRGELPQALEQLRGERFDLVFSDPPYASRAAQKTVDALALNELLAPAA